MTQIVTIICSTMEIHLPSIISVLVSIPSLLDIIQQSVLYRPEQDASRVCREFNRLSGLPNLSERNDVL